MTAALAARLRPVLAAGVPRALGGGWCPVLAEGVIAGLAGRLRAGRTEEVIPGLARRPRPALAAGLILLASLSRAAALPSAADAARPDTAAVDSLNPVPFPEVEVTATRARSPLQEVPFSVDRLGAGSLRGEPGVSLDEALRELPGVAVSDRGNLSQGDRVSIRGIGSRASFGVRGIRVLVDGVPLTMPDGQSQLNNLDLHAVGDVEVLRGPSSWLYGNAAGGVIHFRTRRPAAAAGIEPAVIVGSDGMRQVRASADLVRSGHALLLSAGQLEREGYRDHAAGLTRRFNLVGRHPVTGSVAVTSVFNFVDAPYLLNPSSLSREAADSDPREARFFVRSQGASKRLRQGQGGLTLTAPFRGGSRLQLTLYGLARSLDNPIPGRVIELDRRGGGVRSTFTRPLRLAGREARLTAGIDLEGQWDERAEFANEGLPEERIDAIPASEVLDAVVYGERSLLQEEQVTGLGPFAAFGLKLTPRWTLSAGGRYDRYRFEARDRHLTDGSDDSGERAMARFSPALGIAFSPGGQITAFANYATAFQTPTTVELSNRPGGAGGFNPDLDPELLRSLEAGLRGRWTRRGLEYSLALFRFTLDGMLIPYQLAGSDETFYRNAGRTGNRGLETRLAWRPRPPWRLSLSYSFGDFTFEEFAVERDGERLQLAGNEVPGAPRRQLWSQLEYRIAAFTGRLELRRVGEYFANDFNGPPPGVDKPRDDYVNRAFTTVGARLALRSGMAPPPGAVRRRRQSPRRRLQRLGGAQRLQGPLLRAGPRALRSRRGLCAAGLSFGALRRMGPARPGGHPGSLLANGACAHAGLSPLLD